MSGSAAAWLLQRRPVSLRSLCRFPVQCPRVVCPTHPSSLPASAAEFSTRFAGQIKDFDSDGLVVKKWDKRIDNVMRWGVAYLHLCCSLGWGRLAGSFKRGTRTPFFVWASSCRACAAARAHADLPSKPVLPTASSLAHDSAACRDMHVAGAGRRGPAPRALFQPALLICGPGSTQNWRRYMIVAGKRALADAGLPWEGPELKDLNRARCGILIGAQSVVWVVWSGCRKRLGGLELIGPGPCALLHSVG